MPKTSLRGLIFAVAIGLVVSAVALFMAAAFSMGFALQEPAVVVSCLVVGPALSLTTWTVLIAKSRRTGSTQSATSPMLSLFMLLGGVILSLPLFLFVLLVENQFPGEQKSDVFGPYHTHPYRPLSGITLCLLGLTTGVFLYYFKMRHLAVGVSFGCIALGLLLIIAGLVE